MDWNVAQYRLTEFPVVHLVTIVVETVLRDSFPPTTVSIISLPFSWFSHCSERCPFSPQNVRPWVQCIGLQVHAGAISKHFDDVTIVHVDHVSNWFDSFSHKANEMPPNDSTAFNCHKQNIYSARKVEFIFNFPLYNKYLQSIGWSETTIHSSVIFGEAVSHQMFTKFLFFNFIRSRFGLF